MRVILKGGVIIFGIIKLLGICGGKEYRNI